MKSIEIRKVQPEDIRQLQQISRQTFFEAFATVNTEEDMAKYLEESFSLEKLTDELNNQNSEFYFALFDGHITGYLKINRGASQTELKGENSLEIERIYVLPAFHGKKIGQALYEKAMLKARELNVDIVWLGVWEENMQAISFYRKNGFKEFDKHKFMLGNDEQTDIMMKIQLKNHGDSF